MSGPEPYNLAPDFERQLVATLCRRPALYASIAEFFEPDALGMEASKLALGAAAEITAERGTGPAALVLVLQRLRRWMGGGKITAAQIDAVAALFDAAADAPDALSEADLLDELAPILKHRAVQRSIREAIDLHQRREDPVGAFELFMRSRSIGTSALVPGEVLGAATAAYIESVSQNERFETGIFELDEALGNGAARGTAAMFLAGTSGGKSMGLVQVTAYGCVRGLNAAYATLELPAHMILARVSACLTGIPIDQILDNPTGCGLDARLAELGTRTPAPGTVHVKPFTPKVTTVADLITWVNGLRTHNGKPIDLLVVDYADKLASGHKRADEATSGYVAQGTVYDQLYNWARDHKRWVWTASQAKRSKDKRAPLDIDDVSDSMGKIRNFDVVIPLMIDEEKQATLVVGKNRLGKAGTRIGPLPTELECARIAPFLLPREVRK